MVSSVVILARAIVLMVALVLVSWLGGSMRHSVSEATMESVQQREGKLADTLQVGELQPHRANPKPKQAVPQLEPEPVPPPSDCLKVSCIALTFDDGPSPHTPRLLSFLEKQRIPATFFMIGKYVERHADIVQRINQDGFQIGNHTWAHHNLTKMPDPDIKAEITATSRAIKRVTGRPPHFMRPPFGETNKHIAEVSGMPQILWNVDSYDWRDKNAKLAAERVITTVKPGAIVLMHDIYPSTVDAVPRIVTTLQKRGYHFVTINQLFANKMPLGAYWGQHETTVY